MFLKVSIQWSPEWFTYKACTRFGSDSTSFHKLFSAIDCGPLSAPMNGSSSGDSTVFPNSVLFKCDPGFLLNGSSRRTCQSNGTWNGLITVCVGRYNTKRGKRNHPSFTIYLFYSGALFSIHGISI